ncbi:MAG: flagellar M-ring protein FliF [Ignavibacteria bacterium]|nr:flagellar M-ring protein FliF [Ignavibacteria bacterium]
MAEPITKQLTAFASKLNRAQKYTIGGVVIAALAGMILLVSSTSQPSMAVLFSELDQKDAGVIVEKLKEKKIPFELQSNGTAITVPTNVLHETRLSLASEGLPQSSTVGYEIFDKTNLGMSDFVQKLNYRRALEGELSRTIGSLDEVHKARVHIVVPEKALFDKDQNKATASVILQLKSGRNISKMNTEGIQNLVASSVEGMETNAVTVVDQKGQIISEPPRDKNSLAGLSSTQYELQQKVDQYLTSKVQTLLDGVLGVGNAVVRANAELDFTQVEKTTEDFDPDKQVVQSEQKIDEQTKSVDSLSVPAVNSASQRGNTVTNYEISKKVEKIVSQGGGIKRLSIATLINGSTKIIEGDKPTLEYKPRGRGNAKNYASS